MASQNTFYPPLPNAYTFGDYRIEYPMGQDSMGGTYLAWDAARNAWAFIKENMPQSCAVREADGVQVRPRNGAEDAYLKHLSDFYAEAQAMTEVEHPGVAPVLRFFRDAGTAYYAIPCDGEHTLGQWFEKKGLPDRSALLSLLRSILSALAYLHGKGLGPWDIKPESFMIKEDGSPVLVEFGVLRRLIGGNVDLFQSSPGFAGIELRDGENVGPWTDFYALACTLYTLLTGDPLQDSQSRAKGDVLIPLRNRPALLEMYGKPLLESIDKAMAVEPAQRWQSAEAWSEALASIPAKEPKPEKSPAPEPVEEEPAPVETPVETPVATPAETPAPTPTPEPTPEPREEKPAPAPVAVEEPQPFFPEPTLTPMADLILPKRKKSISTGNAVAIVCGVLLAGAGCGLLLMTDKPDEIMTAVEQGALGHGTLTTPPETHTDNPSATPAETPAETPDTTSQSVAIEPPPAPELPPAPEPAPPAPVEVADVTPTPDPPAPVEEPPAVAEEPVAATDEPVAETVEDPEPPKPAQEDVAQTATEPASLMDAVKAGDKDAAAKFVEKGATPEEIHAAFGVAVSEGHAAIVSLLLDHGVDLKADLRYDGRINALGLAVTRGHAEIADLLLQHNSPKNSRYDGDMTALTIAARDGNVELVRLLLKNKAQHGRQNSEGDSALILAIRGGHVECAKLIIAADADVNLANKKGERALDCAKSPATPLSDKDRSTLIKLLKVNGAKG